MPPTEHTSPVPKSRPPFQTVLILCFLALIAFGTLKLVNKKPIDINIAFAQAIDICNTSPANYRFSCFRSALEKHYGSHDITTLAQAIHDNKGVSFTSADSSYAIFGTNCHTFYHALGDFIATKGAGQDVGALLKDCSLSCTGGCVMGLYKRTALDNSYSTELLKHFWDVCPKDAKHQCTHEIGHVLHDKYTYSVLKPIDELSAREYALALAKDYKYTTFERADLDTPFEDCKKIVPEEELAYCYTGIGHNMFLFSEFNDKGYQSSFDECNRLQDVENKNSCLDFLVFRVGINDAAVKFLSGDFDAGRKVCEDVVVGSTRSDVKQHCYKGIGGGIGLFLESEFSNLTVTPENIERVRENVMKHIDLCEASIEEQKLNCYKGLFGTRVKKFYKELNLTNDIVEKLLPQISDGFEVVG